MSLIKNILKKIKNEGNRIPPATLIVFFLKKVLPRPAPYFTLSP